MTRLDARRAGESKYENGKACPQGHIGPRYVSSGSCCACIEARSTLWASANRPKRRAYQTAYRKSHPGYGAECRKAYRLRNLDKASFYSTRYKAAKLRAVPSWADQAAIKAIYVEAARRQLHVDHIIPLQPRDGSVCGLHCESNLQLLTEHDNKVKADNYERGWR